jgi:hypothetical protein
MGFLDTQTLLFPYYTLLVAGVALVLLYLISQQWRNPLRKLPYPPGPPEGSFITGNMSDMPASRSWLAFEEWGKKYGASYYQFSMPLRSNPANSAIQVAFHTSGFSTNIPLFLTRRRTSSSFSKDGPTSIPTARACLWSTCTMLLIRKAHSNHLPFASFRIGWSKWDVGFMEYGARWRYHRRIFQQYFKPEASINYQPIQTRKVNDMLYSLLKTPANFMEHYRT